MRVQSERTRYLAARVMRDARCDGMLDLVGPRGRVRGSVSINIENDVRACVQGRSGSKRRQGRLALRVGR
jgi:hypothetical protein